MKNFGDNFSKGIVALFFGYGVSYYAYLTIVLAEIFYLWRFLPENALAFTVLLIATCVTICIFGTLKRVWICTRKERLTAVVYWVALSILFAVGCFVDFWQNLILFFVPLAFSFVWIMLRNFQLMRFIDSKWVVLRFISIIFSNWLIWLISFIFVSMCPLGILVYFLNITLPSRFLAVLIAFVYGISLPLITWFEEYFVNENIFEIGYEVTWNEEVEEILRILDVSIEIFGRQEFLDAFNKLEANEDDPERALKEFYDDLQRIQSILNEDKK